MARLVLPEVYPEDGGLYICEAYNEVGDEDSACTLSVMGKEKFTWLSWDWIGNLFWRNLGTGHESW